MKSTGVVRRIDDLGRIVIPKEIRKTLRIRDGEYLQFFLESDNIILQKYSPMIGLPEFYKDYVNSVYSEIGGNVIITDREKIVAISGDLKKRYIDKRISNFLDDIIQNRVISYSLDKTSIDLINEKLDNVSYVIAPIISDGDAIGAVIILFVNENINDFIVRTGSIAAKFLGKYIE